ncbi:MAG: TolC family protein [Nitrospinae bacterium]|nr:TolC family protein [Nitrospinota bacterium]
MDKFRPCSIYLLLSLLLVSTAFSPSLVESGEKDNVKLAVKDAIKIALEKNLSLKFGSLEPEIKKTDIEIGEAAFDPKVLGGVYGQKDRRPFASAFAKPDIGDNLEEEWRIGLAQKLKLGTEYDFTLRSKMKDTNSLYAGLDPEYGSEVSLNFTQPLLREFGTDINSTNILVAKNNKNISDLQFKQMMIDVATNAQNAYWDLVYARENLKVQVESLNLAKDFERRIEAQVKVGTMAPIEILQAKAEVAARDEDIILAKNNLEKASDALKEIMNLGDDLYNWGGLIDPIDQPSFIVEKTELDKKISAAMEKRPDMLELKKTLENENIHVKYNENKLYPSLDLVGSLGLNGMSGTAKAVGFGADVSQSRFGGGYGKDFDRMFSGDFYSWKVGVNVEYPLGNRLAKNELSASKLRVQKLLFQLKDIEKKIALEVRSGVRDMETNIQRVESTRVSRKLAEEKLDAEEKKFEAGLSTSFNVLSYQKDLTTQETAEIKAIIDYNRSIVGLQKTVAETLDVNGIQLQ